jgi:hypothetical protein
MGIQSRQMTGHANGLAFTQAVRACYFDIRVPATDKRKARKAPRQEPPTAAPSPSRFPFRSAGLWLMTAIFVLAAFLRFHDLGALPPGLFFDEAMNGVNAVEANQSGNYQVFYADNNGREGLFINIQALFLKLFEFFGNSSPFNVEPWMLRVPSAIFGTLTVIGLFFLTRILTRSDFTAGAAAFFIATSFWHINFSRIGLRAISAVFWLVWGLYFLLLGFSKLREERKQRAYVLLAIAGLIYGAGFHSYIAYRLTPALVLLVLAWLAIQLDNKALWLRGAAVFLSTAMVVAAPLALYFLRHPDAFFARISQVSVLSSKNVEHRLWSNIRATALMLNVAGDRLARHNVTGRPEVFLPVGILLLLGLGLGLYLLVQRKASAWPYVICTFWLVLGAIPAIMSNENLPHALRSILMIPPSFILAALAADQVRLWLTPRVSGENLVIAASALALILAGEAYWTYFHTFASDPRTKEAFEGNLADVGREVAAAPTTVDKYLVFIRAKLDDRGNPHDFYSMLFLSGGFNQTERANRNIHIVVKRDEAERVSRLPGAYVWVF